MLKGVIKSVGEEYLGCGKEYNVKKGNEKAITSSQMILMLLGRIPRREVGNGHYKCWEENQDLKKLVVGKKISCRELHTFLY